MKVNWIKDGCEIIFSDEEKKIIPEKGKLVMNYRYTKDFINMFANMVMQMQSELSERDSSFDDLTTSHDSEIRTS